MSVGERLGLRDVIPDAERVATLVYPAEGYSGIGTDHNAVTLDTTIGSVLDISAAQVLSADAALVRGDVIIADATPNLTLLNVGAANTVFFSDGTDPAWAAANANVPVAPTAQGDILIADGTPVWSVLNIGAQYTHLESSGTTLAWQVNITLADDATVGLAAGGNLQFDSTPAPDQIILNSADLNLNGNDIYVPDNTADALTLYDGGPLNYLRIISINAQPVVVWNEGGADVDFRIEGSGVANALFVQGSDGFVGVNTNAPAAHVEINAATATDVGVIIQTTDDDTTNALTEWQDSGASNLAEVNAIGHFGIGTAASTTRLINAVKTINSAGSIEAVAGQITNSGAGDGYGLSFSGITSGGGNAVGVNAVGRATAGSPTRIVGVQPGTRMDSAGTVAQAYSIRVTNLDLNAGAVTTQWGIRILSMSGATTNYALETNNGLTVFNQSSDASSDFRVESGGYTHMLFVDAGFDSVLINSSADLSSTFGVVCTANTDIGVVVRGAAAQGTDLVVFEDSGGNNFFESGTGLANGVTTWNQQGVDIDFVIEGVGAANAFFLQGSDGHVGFGTNGPGTTVHIYTATSQDGLTIERDGTGTELKIYWETGGNRRWNWGLEDNATENLWLYNYGTTSFIQFWEYSTGDIGMGDGMTSPAAQLHIDQANAAGAQPVLILDQGDASEQCIQFSSDGADRDIYLWTVDVTGAPALMWDESEDAYSWDRSHIMANGTYIGQPAGPTITFDDTNNFLEITGLGRVLVNSGTNDANVTAVLLAIDGNIGISQDGALGTVDIYTYGVAAAIFPSFRGRAARTSRAAPAAVQAGDILARFGGAGYGATGFASSNRAFLQVEATQTWTDANQGCEIVFYTTPDNTVAPVLRGTIEQDGGWIIGNLTSTSENFHIYDTANASAEIQTTNVNGTATLRLTNDAQTWSIATNANDFLQFRDVTAAANRLLINGSGDVYPGSSKGQDLGLSGSEWDNFYYVTLNQGTSRLINSAMNCPVCAEPMKKGTGGMNILGEVANYELVFCISCGAVAVETRARQTPEMIAARRPPPKVEFAGIRTKMMGPHDYKVTVDFDYGDGVANSTRLGDDELAALLAMTTDEERRAFLRALGEREWYAREEARMMEEHVAALRGQYEALVAGLVGVDLLQ